MTTQQLVATPNHPLVEASPAGGKSNSDGIASPATNEEGGGDILIDWEGEDPKFAFGEVSDPEYEITGRKDLRLERFRVVALQKP